MTAEPSVTELTVPSSLHGERVDRGIALLTGLTRSQAARLVSQGRASVGGRVLTSGSRRLSQGERLHVDLAGPEDAGTAGAHGADAGTAGGYAADGYMAGDDNDGSGSGAGAGEEGTPGGAARAQGGSQLARIVYVDEHVVVVDKPAGLVVHPGAGNAGGTLVQQLLAQYPDLASAGPDRERPGIVHRIDKGTSGLLMVARTAPAREDLTAQLGARTVERRYLAAVHGEVEADEGTIEAPLGRSQRDRVKVAVVEGGRHARTDYRSLSRSPSPLPVTLLACRLGTGRTHQIRAHMTAIEHPVLHDERYAKPRLVAAARQVLPELRRPWLHAAVLGFTHPATGERMNFRSPLPEDLAATLALLGLDLPEGAGEDW